MGRVDVRAAGRLRRSAGTVRGSSLLAPWVVFNLVVGLFSVGSLVATSLWQNGGPGVIIKQASLENYISLITQPEFSGPILRSFGVGALVIVFCIGIGVPAAFGLARPGTPTWLTRIAMVVFALPFLAGPMVRIVGLTALLGKSGGINELLLVTDAIHSPIAWLLQSQFTLYLALVYNNLGFVIFPAWLAMEQVSREEYLAASDFGASRSQVFFHVVVPRARLGIMAGAVLVAVSVGGAFLEPQRLAATARDLLASAVSNQYLNTVNWPLGSALAVALIVVTIALALAGMLAVWLVTLVLSRWSLPMIPVRAIRTRLAVVPVSTIITCLALLFLAVPIMLIAVFSLNSSPYYGFPITNWTFSWYVKAATETDTLRALTSSAELALAGAVIATLLATPFAYALARRGRNVPGWILALGLWPMLLPTMLIGIALQIFIAQSGVIQLGFWPTALGYVFYSAPFIILVAYASLSNVRWSVEIAGYDLGASRWTVFRRILLPLIWPAMRSGFLLGFFLIFNDYNIGLFLARGFNTLPVYISGAGTTGVQPDVLALATIVNMIVIASLTVLLSAYRGMRRRVSGGSDV